MKEKFAKLLLGEDMSGTGKGVPSALALSNAVTNLAASVFGEHRKLEPMAPDTKERWKREVGWLLSVTDHIVEFVPTRHTSENGITMEVTTSSFACARLAVSRDACVRLPAPAGGDVVSYVQFLDLADHVHGAAARPRHEHPRAAEARRHAPRECSIDLSFVFSVFAMIEWLDGSILLAAGLHGQLRGPDRVLVREGRGQQARRRQVVDADGEGAVGGAVGRDPQVAAVPEGVREPGAQGGHGHQRPGACGDGDPGGVH
jgi:hypothetical protein